MSAGDVWVDIGKILKLSQLLFWIILNYCAVASLYCRMVPQKQPLMHKLSLSPSLPHEILWQQIPPNHSIIIIIGTGGLRPGGDFSTSARARTLMRAHVTCHMSHLHMRAHVMCTLD